ncbi:hypothetical protein WAF17_10730 [Bernardetia sp. ABR2-2B]|uniref:hypothetical protein n=1 Tax=Bernardetia sp. ABR2-2B TaxID=3127472 RepID=UPI0030CD6376
MKKRLIILLNLLILATFTMGFTSDITHSEVQSHYFEILDCKYGQCKATAKSTGKQCKHCVSNSGENYCWQYK